MLVKYVRHLFDFHKLVGCVVAIFVDDKIKVGWSQCRLNEPFDKTFAKELAVGRAYLDTTVRPCPYKMYDPDGTITRVDVVAEEVADMWARAERYYRRTTPQIRANSRTGQSALTAGSVV